MPDYVKHDTDYDVLGCYVILAVKCQRIAGLPVPCKDDEL